MTQALMQEITEPRDAPLPLLTNLGVHILSCQDRMQGSRRFSGIKT